MKKNDLKVVGDKVKAQSGEVLGGQSAGKNKNRKKKQTYFSTGRARARGRYVTLKGRRSSKNI
jgi:hypothetical protein